jgi:Flp pilus assembly protein TadD
MSAKPHFFTLPVTRFDTNLLPPDARQIGTEPFKQAVLAHFAAQYASRGEQAVVSVDAKEISVLVVPRGENPFGFVLSMLQSGRIKEATPYLEALTKTDPGNAEVLYNLGVAYSELGHYDEAIIRLKRVVSLSPKHARAWTAIGVAYQRMGKRDQAMEPFQKAVEADPTDGYAQRNLGAMLMSTDRKQEALQHLREAYKALPDDPQTSYGLAAALEAAGGDENVTEADRLYRLVVERFPAEPARQARTKLAHETMRSQVGGGLRPDVLMYIAGALDTFEKVGPAKQKQIAFEIALKGQSGLNINDPEQKYTLKSLPGTFSGLHLVSIMYTAFRQIDPEMDVGVDLQKEPPSRTPRRLAKTCSYTPEPRETSSPTPLATPLPAC